MNRAHPAQDPGWNIVVLVGPGVQGVGAPGGGEQGPGVAGTGHPAFQERLRILLVVFEPLAAEAYDIAQRDVAELRIRSGHQSAGYRSGTDGLIAEVRDADLGPAGTKLGHRGLGFCGLTWPVGRSRREYGRGKRDPERHRRIILGSRGFGSSRDEEVGKRAYEGLARPSVP